MKTIINIKLFKQFLGQKVWSLFIFSIFLGGLWFAVEMFFVFVLQSFLRALNLLNSSSVDIPAFLPTSFNGALVFLILYGFARAIVYVLKEYYSGITNQAFIKEKRYEIMDYSIHHAKTLKKHDIITIYNERIAQSGGLIKQISSLIHTLTSSSLLFFYGLTLAPFELLIGIFLLMLLIYPLHLIDKKISSFGEGIVTESTLSNKILMLSLQNHYFLKVYNLITRQLVDAEASLSRYEDLFKKHYFWANVKHAIPMFFGVLIIAILTYLGMTVFHTKEVKLLSLFYIFIRMAQSFGLLAVTVANLKVNYKGFLVLFNWHRSHLDNKAIIESNVTKPLLDSEIDSLLKRLSSNNYSLTARNLEFSYSNEQVLLSNVNFELFKGDIFLVQGKSGSGKSTLLNLIMGLEKPTSGEVTYCDIPTEQSIRHMASSLGYVGPEPYLIAGTVRENLLYGIDYEHSISDEDIWSSLNAAQVSDVILSMDNKLDEKLNELTQLSTGQKQRLAMARALIRKPKILILDEATANLDTHTEAKFIDTLKPLSKDIIIIAISHKDSFDKLATKAIHL